MKKHIRLPVLALLALLVDCATLCDVYKKDIQYAAPLQTLIADGCNCLALGVPSVQILCIGEASTYTFGTKTAAQWYATYCAEPSAPTATPAKRPTTVAELDAALEAAGATRK